MTGDPPKRSRSVFEKYGIRVSDMLYQPSTDTIDPGVLGDDYAPQSEESKKFIDEWEQKGAGEKFRTGVKAGWEQAKGGLKYAGAEILPYLLSGVPGNIPSPEIQRAIHTEGITKTKESAEKNFAAMPQGKGFLYETGMFIPQIAGTMAALAAAPITGGTSAAAVPMIIGTANTAALGGMVVGQTLHDYDQYTTEKGIEPNELTRWGVALGAGAAEFAAEKLRLGRLLPDGLAGKMMSKTLQANPNLSDDMLRNWAKNDPIAFGKFKKLAGTTLRNMGEEGAEEAATEFVQSYLNNIYLNPEDRATFSDVINNTAHAFKAGAMMGGMLGPASYSSNQMYHNMRRKRNGVTLVETSGGKVFEFLGADPKKPDMAAVVDNRGNVSSLNRNVITDHRTMTGTELREYLNVYRDAQENLPDLEAQHRVSVLLTHLSRNIDNDYVCLFPIKKNDHEKQARDVSAGSAVV